jgi:hypothetical protein
MHPRQGAPACPARRPAMQRECMLGTLAGFHDPRGLHYRLAEVLEPSGGISMPLPMNDESLTTVHNERGYGFASRRTGSYTL